MDLHNYETENLEAAQQAAWLAHATRKPLGTLSMYNRGTQQFVTHNASILRVQTQGIRLAAADATTQVSGGWRELTPTLRDGARLSITLHLPDTLPARLYRGNLLGAMLDQTLERFVLTPSAINRLGAASITFWAFAFVARNLGLSDAPTAIADLEISGEVVLGG